MKNIQVSDELHTQLKEITKQTGQSIRWVVDNLVREYVEKNK